jgi:hypothetical protein
MQNQERHHFRGQDLENLECSQRQGKAMIGARSPCGSPSELIAEPDRALLLPLVEDLRQIRLS